MANEVDTILHENKRVKNNDWALKLPTFLKLNIIFSIVSLAGLIMGLVALSFIATGQSNAENNWHIFWMSLAFFLVGYLFGLIYSACLFALYPQSAKKVSLLKAHYIINFVPIANTIAFITAIIIVRKHEYDSI